MTLQKDKEVARSSSNRRILILVALVFALPVAASMSLHLSGWRPSSTGNHGQLIQPVRQLQDLTLQTLDGKPVHVNELHGKWTMVHFGPSSCPESCIKILYSMRQIHTAQGKEIDRVQRVFILTDEAAAGTLKAKLTDYPGMRIWKGDGQTLKALAKDFGIQNERLAQDQGVYIIDPRGNLMMRYAPGADPAGMRKDIARLLKYSWVG